ncbi:DsbA family protein [Schaalia hyovaginalis]|uniref:DsbA family oxidoreductase n=1 Tax=Schaalia hyovaginalis TaxID=29316 RepID=UPI001F308787|nr:DsbA family protein [Schaalia hyovaginalis]MDD7554879.1 DsbA family protein [Schaalia hyovaginalis]MDY3094541.1 DsbA family protein [Schaalia hyovaginalis]
MHIDYWFDLTSPWCYLGLRHLRSALSGFAHADEVEVALHAFLLDPELVPSKALPRRVHLIENVGLTLEEARDLDARLVELGRAEGLALDLDRALVVPTSNAHRAIAAAADRDLELGATTGADTYALKLAEAIHRSHFEMGLDVSDPDVLVGCAQDVGIEAERIVAALASVEHGSRVFSDFQIGAQMGIDLVPTYLIDQRFLVQDHQTVTAMGNILNAAWTNSGKEQ